MRHIFTHEYTQDVDDNEEIHQQKENIFVTTADEVEVEKKKLNLIIFPLAAEEKEEKNFFSFLSFFLLLSKGICGPHFDDPFYESLAGG